jgi:hypothetical protein
MLYSGCFKADVIQLLQYILYRVCLKADVIQSLHWMLYSGCFKADVIQRMSYSGFFTLSLRWMTLEPWMLYPA